MPPIHPGRFTSVRGSALALPHLQGIINPETTRCHSQAGAWHVSFLAPWEALAGRTRRLLD